MSFRGAAVLILVAAMAILAPAQRRGKKTEEATQTLPVLPDPPNEVSAPTERLVFRVSPLSAKGLLSQQVREALKQLLHEAHGASIVKLRAFVAGSGDTRRVASIVSETFTDHKLPLPAVSTIEVGALPLEAAQVVIESTEVDKKTQNPNGLAFYSATPVAELRPVSNVLRATCFLSSLDDMAKTHAKVSAAFSGATIDYVQAQRLGLEPLDVCEAVARLDAAPARPVVIQNGVAIVNAPEIVFTGAQMAFGETPADVKLAFERLGKILGSAGASYKDVFWLSSYPLTRPVEDKMRAAEPQFLERTAGTMLLFEGLPSLDGTMAMEAMAAK